MAKVPCPYCGRLVDRLIEGMCEECYIERHPLISLFDSTLLKCKFCGAIFLKGRWIKTEKVEKTNFFRKVLTEKGVVRGLVENLEISENKEGVTITVTVRGSPHPHILPRALTYKFFIKYNYDICNYCKEILSKKEVALLQIRTIPRGLDEQLKKKILAIIEHERFKLREKKVGHISNIEFMENGIDIYTTSISLARHLTYVLHKEFPSHVIESAKVVGVKNSKKVYHMTYSLRILTYKPGDIIRMGDEELTIIHINNKFISLYNKKTKKIENVTISKFINSNIVFIE
ncbi:NMD3 [Pyrobaculum islandicum DSM 4184]|uniref:NMD3 n=1 Tax=Pyrobaculum islandicum (strain DSM 4184 / JCM 9189 / GEO3) TaxID=384616 RepID=A1RV44_PYRIL|nr:NMD3-related protein [Pyrobaculum islandicum]ABL88826.1 NMD3 [Pyrobaculum islandicum DSM 4184]